MRDPFKWNSVAEPNWFGGAYQTDEQPFLSMRAEVKKRSNDIRLAKAAAVRSYREHRITIVGIGD